MKYNILVVEDEKGIRETVVIFLKNQGYHTIEATNGEEALQIVETEEIHLAIVDIMMPIMDGITLTMKIRQQHMFPIIMLTAKSEDIDKVMGLNIGADDYVTKPFNSMELLARVNSQLRRYQQILDLKNNYKTNTEEHIHIVGHLQLDTHSKQVTIHDIPIKVTPKEFQILQLLIANPGRVYSAEQIYEHVWKEEAINTETIMVHIRNLREKIEANPKKPIYLKVVWGIGYKIEKV